MPALLVPHIETLGIGSLQPAHSRHQIRLRSLKQHVVVVPHQDIRMHPPATAPDRLAKRVQEHLAIAVVPEYRRPAVPPAHRMVDRPGIFNSRFSRHDTISITPPREAQDRKTSNYRTDPSASPLL